MYSIPPMPDSPDLVHAKTKISMRYEDICQDGRMMTIGMPHALGSLWRESIQAMPIWEARKQGIIPILAQMWMHGTEDQFHIGKPTLCEGSALLAHTVNEEGEVARILLDMRARIFATRGSVLGAQPEGAGELVLAGEVYARHVFTRLFAAPGDRRVLKLEVPGVPEVPECQVPWVDFEHMLPMPESAEFLDPHPSASTYQPVFAPHHCDSNQHVNSLVYPRLFEDAAHQRFADNGSGNDKLSRDVALSFRRPFFSGNRSTLKLQSYRDGDALGVTGAFEGAGEKTHCDVHMRFM